MFLAAGGLALTTLLTIAVAGVANARVRVRHFDKENADVFPANNSLGTEGNLLEGTDQSEINTLEMAFFSSSLLSAVKVHSEARHVSLGKNPELAHVSVE
jgi:hypothetical protein